MRLQVRWYDDYHMSNSNSNGKSVCWWWDDMTMWVPHMQCTIALYCCNCFAWCVQVSKASQSASAFPLAQWQCARCTLINSPKVAHCLVCGAIRSRANRKTCSPNPVIKQDSQKVLLLDIRSSKGRDEFDMSNSTIAIASSLASSASSSSSSSSSLSPLQLGWHVVRAEDKYGLGASPARLEEWFACLFEIYRHAGAVYAAVTSERRGRRASVMDVLFHV